MFRFFALLDFAVAVDPPVNDMYIPVDIRGNYRIMGNDNNGMPFFFIQFTKYIHDFHFRLRIQITGWLIRKNNFRFTNE